MGLFDLDSSFNFSATKTDINEIAEKVRQAKKNYPSLRVVGRGTIVVDAEDILKSEKFQEQKAKVGSLFESKRYPG